MNNKIDALVLAAGQSSRMLPYNKVLLPTKDGQTVISLLLSTLLESLSGQILVILGCNELKVQKSILGSNLDTIERLDFKFNPNYRDGMSTSLVLGIKAFEKTENGLAVFLADQPLISTADISALTYAYSNRTEDCLAVAAAKGQKRLNPVIFTPDLLAKLQQLSGDVGAKAVLQKHREQVQLVDLGDGVWGRDIDDWEGYCGVARAANWTDALNFIKTQG